MAKLNMGKSRTPDDPYLTVTDGTFTWKVLKAYSGDPDAQYARWFLATSSPYTFGSDELGDGYISEVRGVITQRRPEVADADLPRHLRNAVTITVVQR